MTDTHFVEAGLERPILEIKVSERKFRSGWIRLGRVIA